MAAIISARLIPMQKPAKENPTIRKVKVVECLTNARDSVPPVGGESTMIGRPKWFPKSYDISRTF